MSKAYLMMWPRQFVWTLCTLVYEFFFLNFHLPDVDHQAVDLFPGVFLVQMDSLTGRVMLLLLLPPKGIQTTNIYLFVLQVTFTAVSLFVFRCESDIQSV